MKTAESIEAQAERKKAEKTGRVASQNSGSVSGRRGRVENLKPFPKGVSGNPGGKPKVDLAAQIARAIFENDGPAIYAAFAKMLRRGSPYAFQILSERAFGNCVRCRGITGGRRFSFCAAMCWRWWSA